MLVRYPYQLSGGMRQLVMIVMALSCKPSLLIADEPTTALDVTIQAQILQLIRILCREMQMAVIFISHDMGVVAEIADRVLVMCRGEQVEHNTVHKMFAAPQHPYTQALLAAVPRLGAIADQRFTAKFPLPDGGENGMPHGYRAGQRPADLTSRIFGHALRSAQRHSELCQPSGVRGGKYQLRSLPR